MSLFRQHEDYYLSSEISLMECNPTMDLIALATTTGELCLLRHSWQKVWSLPSFSTQEKTLVITAMAWRPDGEILACAYSNGHVNLFDVENGETMHTLKIETLITSLNWVQCMKDKDDQENVFYKDRSESYLFKYYAIKKTVSTSGQSEELKYDLFKMKGQKELNILAIGMENGMVHLHSFGMVPLGWIDVKIDPEIQSETKILSVNLSKDCRLLTAVLASHEQRGYCYYYRSYHMPLLSDKMPEIKIVALKCMQIASLMAFLSHTIRAILEAWEKVVMEMDNRLQNLALEKANDEASISDDFMELLLFGNPSAALENFLIHDLKESGLKKFRTSIEVSYRNIQKLVMKRLQGIVSSLHYQLNELAGMAQCHMSFDKIGLDEEAIHKASMTAASLLLKATEVQQVIDNSMKNFKMFFRWLYTVILRLTDKPIPDDVTNLSLHDLESVGNFLQENFVDKVTKEGRKTVRLEKVGQYLQPDNLECPMSTIGNPWIEFLEKNPCIEQTGLIFKRYPEKSLLTLYQDFRSHVCDATTGTWNEFNKSITRQPFHHLNDNKEMSPPNLSHIALDETSYTVVTDQSTPCNGFFFMQEHSKKSGLFAVAVNFRRLPKSDVPNSEHKDKNYKVLDVKFYNKEAISVLLIEYTNPEAHPPLLFQLPLSFLVPKLKLLVKSTSYDTHIVNGNQFMDEFNIKPIENAQVEKMAVSGSRKIVSVLFKSKRQVRLFEMGVEKEADDSTAKMEANV